MRLKALFHRLMPARAARDVARSNLFDAGHYAAAYSDVQASGLSPLNHYMQIGARELRNSSPNFEARSLLRYEPEFQPGRDNPVLFLEARRRSGHGKLLAPRNAALRVDDLLDLLNAASCNPRASIAPAVDVIVPVHNSLAQLVPLLDTLLRNTDAHHHIILIDDASSEAGVRDALGTFAAQRPNTHLTVNQRNLGFAASVNAGLRHSDRHKVLLNSDTLVPVGWLDVLMEPILRDPAVASVTPYSNSSSYTGFPENRIELPLVCGPDLAAVNEALSMFPALDREIISGVGFCMALSAKAVHDVGLLDDVSFRQGYYEETHWCYRARRAGFRNVLANRLYVGHDHASTSFGLKRKLKALRRSESRMRHRFPDYFDQMDAFYTSDPHADLRQQSCLAAACRDHTIAIVTDVDQAQPYKATDILFRLASEAGTVSVHIHPCRGEWKLTAHTPRYGPIEFAGTLQQTVELTSRLGVRELFCAPSCNQKTVDIVLATVTGSDMKITCFSDFEADAAQVGRDGRPCDHRKLKHAPTPYVLDDWKAVVGDPNAAVDPAALCVAVLGTPSLSPQPAKVRRLLDYALSENKPFRVVVFGDPPNALPEDARVCRTGIYRFENVPALLRHYGANVVYFPTTGDLSFAFTCRDVLEMGLPVLSHDRGPTPHASHPHPHWALEPATNADATYAALDRLWQAHLPQSDVSPAFP